MSMPPVLERLYKSCVERRNHYEITGMEFETMLMSDFISEMEQEFGIEPQTEDARVFGDDWVYCKDHVRPHPTGWCTVDVGHKLGLGIPPGDYNERSRAAYRKCREFGLKIYGEGE